jgi:hypothetical protein
LRQSASGGWARAVAGAVVDDFFLFSQFNINKCPF